MQRLLADVTDLLEQMELAVRDLPAGRYFLLKICFRYYVYVVFSSADRTKYELRVRSYRSDKRQLDSELEKAVRRLREGADRNELLAYDEAVSMDQQVRQFYKKSNNFLR